MDPRRFAAILRRRAVPLVGVVLVGLLVGFVIAPRTAVYRAEALLYVGRPITSATAPSDTFGPALLANLLAPVVSADQVALAAVKESRVDRQPGAVARATTAVAIPGTTLIAVSVSDPDPQVSEELTNAVATAFAQLASTLPPLLAGEGVQAPVSSTTTTVPGTTTTTRPAVAQPKGGSGRATPLEVSPTTTVPPSATQPGKAEVVSVYKTALLPTASEGQDTGRYLGLGAVIALVIGLALVALVDLTGLTARTPAQLEEQLDMVVVGVLPRNREMPARLARSGDS